MAVKMVRQCSYHITNDFMHWHNVTTRHSLASRLVNHSKHEHTVKYMYFAAPFQPKKRWSTLLSLCYERFFTNKQGSIRHCATGCLWHHSSQSMHLLHCAWKTLLI